MGDATVNGDMPHSATLEHFVGYPVVNDSIEAFKSNPYGQKSINLTNAAYSKFAKPFFPYLETPASYAKPYAIKVDEFGNFFLDKVDEKVPVLKSETKEVKSTIVGYVNWPMEKANETKSYVFDLYNSEYKKCGGDGIVAGGKAVVTSSLVLTSETLSWLSQFLSTKKEQAKDLAKDAQAKAEKYASDLKTYGEKYAKDAQEKGEQYAKLVKEKGEEYATWAQEKGEEYAKIAQEKGEEYATWAQDKGEEYAKIAQEKGEEYANNVQQYGEQYAKDVQEKGEEYAKEAQKKTEEAADKADQKIDS